MAERAKTASIEAELSSMPDDIRALLELGEERAARDGGLQPDGTHLSFLGKDVKVHVVAPLNKPLPDYVTAAETVTEPESFIDYIRNFKSDTAICKASLGTNQIVAVLDYHGRAREGDRPDARPNRAAHTVTLKCPFDPDYLKWKQAFAEPLDQKELAEFIEDMVYTIADPAAADLLEAVTDLKIDRSIRFKSSRNQRNGTIQFTYEEVDAERPAEETVTLPELLTIVVPVFQGGNPQQLAVRLRHRMDRGQVAFHLSIAGIEKVERDAFRSIGNSVVTATSTPLYYTA